MKKRLMLLVVLLLMFSSTIGLCYAATYEHYVETTDKTSWVTRNTAWTQSTTSGGAVELEVQSSIRVSNGLFSDKAHIRDVYPIGFMDGSRFDTARGRVWGDSGGAKYTEWVLPTQTGGSGEQSTKYSNSYTFMVQIKDD